jgi:SAM-dependent methyltransferase
MDRVTEPELMTDEEQARAYADADFEDAHGRCLELLRGFVGDSLPEQGVALDLGCGPGDISCRFARAYPGWSVHGVDGAAAMLQEGRRILEGDGDLKERITLVEGFLPGAELPRRHYDFVFSNSLLHHLHDPRVLWDAVRAHAAPGAPVFIMDLMRPATVEEVERLVQEYAGGEPEVHRLDFYNSLRAAFEVEEVEAQLRAAGLDGFTVRAVSDRHLVVTGRGIPG